jgi:hypothetical protein
MFVAVDLLHLDDRDLRGLPLVVRKRLLDDLHLVGPAWVVNSWYLPYLPGAGITPRDGAHGYRGVCPLRGDGCSVGTTLLLDAWWRPRGLQTRASGP